MTAGAPLTIPGSCWRQNMSAARVYIYPLSANTANMVLTANIHAATLVLPMSAGCAISANTANTANIHERRFA